jgi:DNA-binding NarL/FixJ family response regulator
MERDFTGYLTDRVREIETPPPLTRRELAVVFLLSHGLRCKQIAAMLYVEESTVRSHIEAMVAKLDARSQAHAVATALRLGLID